MPRSGTRALLDQHWRAQGRIGAGVSATSLREWSRVNPLSLAESAALWLAMMVAVIRGERFRSRQSAAAFYRLYRALETGYTVPPLDGPDGREAVSLGELRDEWAQLTETVRQPEPDDWDLVQVDEFDWPEEPDAFERAAVASLTATGPAKVREELERLESREDAGRGRLDDTDFLADLNDAMTNAGVTSAGAADREALRGGRDLISQASRADRRVRGWARVTDGGPCAFCAMLASRGAIYRSEAEAFFRGRDGATEIPEDPDELLKLEKYHNNCHCQVVPIYNRNDFLTPEARQLSKDWERVTKGTTGAESRRVWRQYIDAQRRARRP